MFLRSPIAFSTRSRGFTTRRFHPILKEFRRTGHRHRRPMGTPVHVTADGIVLSAGWDAGSGRTVKIRIPAAAPATASPRSGASSGDREAARRGHRFRGASGLATAPHLDYRVRVPPTALPDVAQTCPRGALARRSGGVRPLARASGWRAHRYDAPSARAHGAARAERGGGPGRGRRVIRPHSLSGRPRRRHDIWPLGLFSPSRRRSTLRSTSPSVTSSSASVVTCCARTARRLRLRRGDGTTSARRHQRRRQYAEHATGGGARAQRSPRGAVAPARRRRADRGGRPVAGPRAAQDGTRRRAWRDLERG